MRHLRVTFGIDRVGLSQLVGNGTASETDTKRFLIGGYRL